MYYIYICICIYTYILFSDSHPNKCAAVRTSASSSVREDYLCRKNQAAKEKNFQTLGGTPSSKPENNDRRIEGDTIQQLKI